MFCDSYYYQYYYYYYHRYYYYYYDYDYYDCVQHPRYSHFGNYPNDIALLELSEGVQGARTAARPACLQGQGQRTYQEKASSFYEYDTKGCWITGWGATLGEEE